MSNVSMQVIEEENEIFPLFRTITKPLILSDFQTIFSDKEGINPETNINDIDMEISQQELIKLLLE